MGRRNYSWLSRSIIMILVMHKLSLVRLISVTINALKRKPEGAAQALDNNVDEPDRTAVVSVFASRVSDGNLDFTNIPARPNPSLTITDDDADFSGRSDDHRHVGSPLRGSRTHKIYPRRNILISQSACKSQGVSARCMDAIALLLAAALGLGVGEAQAQTAVCSNTPATEERIQCTTSDDVDIDIDVKDVTVTTDDQSAYGIYGLHEGTGDVNIDVKDSDVTTNGQTAYGIYGIHRGADDVNIDVKDSTVTTNGKFAHGVFGRHFNAGDVNIDVKDVTVTTNDESSFGISGRHFKAGDVNIDAKDVTVTTTGEDNFGVFGGHHGVGDINIDAKDVTVTTEGNKAHGIYGIHRLTDLSDVNIDVGDINIDVKNSTVTTNDHQQAYGIYGWHQDTGDINIDVKNSSVTSNNGKYATGVIGTHEGAGNINIDARDVTVKATGERAHGVVGWHKDAGDINIDVKNSTVTTNGIFAYGFYVLHQGTAGDVNIDTKNVTVKTTGKYATGVIGTHEGAGNINIDARDVTVKATGERAHGVLGWHKDAGDINIDVKNSTVTTNGIFAYGFYGLHQGTAGDVNIDAKDVTVTTMGEYAHGIYGRHLGAGDDVNIDVKDGAITTTGDNAHGILGYQSGMGSIDILVNGGTILASGMDASGVQVGRINSETDAVERAAEVGDDGYRRQSVTVNGRVFGGTGEGAGVFLAGGGKVIIGPNGSVGAESGVAIRAARQDPTETAPKLHLTLNPGGRRIARVLDDDYIVNDGGQTHILFNGVLLHHGDDGNTGYVAPNGAFDVTLKDEGVKVTDRSDPANWVITELADDVTDDRDFSADDFIEVYAPRAALYEALPGLLLRLNGRGPAAERPRSPVWVRLSGGWGSYEPYQAGVGAEYDFERFEVEVGVNHPLGENLSGSVALRHVQGSGDVSSPAGGGEIDATGIGVSFGTHWSAANGNYLASRLSLTDYDVDISTDKRGRLKGSGGALGHLLSLEAGRRAALSERMTLTTRAWLTRSGISMNFTDKVGSRVSLSESRQLKSGLEVVAETERDEERKLAFRGSLGVDWILSGDGTTAKVSGEKLESESDGTRILLSLGGTYRSGNFAFSGEVSGSGLSSDDQEYSSQLNLEMRF